MVLKKQAKQNLLPNIPLKKATKLFFNASTLEVAKNLLGCFIVCDSPEGRTIGKIVETEAYLCDDPASHSFRGKTKRNRAMFKGPGKAYIYFTYGMHFCFNITTNKKDIGEAVLIRALEPISGIGLMKQRRKVAETKNLCNGPAKLVQALGITKEYYGLDLLESSSRLKLYKPLKKESFTIVTAKRVGISQGQEYPYRFYIKDNTYVSKK